MTDPLTSHRGLEATIGVDRDEFSLDLTLSIPPGTTLALLGPNGAGKSTAVSALAGLIAIDRGSVELAGRVLDRPADTGHDAIFVPAEQRRVGVVFQRFALFPHLSVVDNVAFGIRHGDQQLSKQAAQAKAMLLLEALGVESVARSQSSSISGGQAQRVALARALAIEPDLLLLDEPLSALDVSTRAELRRTLRDHLGTFAGPRLLITHEPSEAFVLADHVCIIEDGRLVQSGTPDEIRAHPATSYVADLAGLNLLAGSSNNSLLTLDGSSLELRTASPHQGRVLASIRPNAVALHASSPGGSPRNTWQSRVTSLEPLGDTVRVQLDLPLPLMVDITPSAANELGLCPGSEVWAAVKATEIAVSPD